MSDLSLVLELYRAAQNLKPSEFAKAAFAWLKPQVDFARSVLVTSWRGATWVDAHFHNVPDPRALMESHAKVRHLDTLTEKMLENPNVVMRQDYDHASIRGPSCEPFREHLRRFDANYTLSIAIPKPEDDALLTLILIRGWTEPPLEPFREEDVHRLESLAPHIAEAVAINRGMALKKEGFEPDALPVAFMDVDGRFLQTTPAFVHSFWEGAAPPSSAYLSKPILRAIEKGRPHLLPNGKFTLYAQRESTGGWILRLRSSGPVDRLSVREREIATLFARGVSYKTIASQLSITPVTVRNHLQKIYAKLAVSERDELIALLAKP